MRRAGGCGETSELFTWEMYWPGTLGFEIRCFYHVYSMRIKDTITSVLDVEMLLIITYSRDISRSVRFCSHLLLKVKERVCRGCSCSRYLIDRFRTRQFSPGQARRHRLQQPNLESKAKKSGDRLELALNN